MGKIMLVEDDETMRTLLQTLLELEGYSVYLSSEKTNDSILSEIKREKPDLILLDIHVYQSNGLHIMKKIRKSPSTEKITVLMTSGMNMEDECMKAGANGFLLKPYMPDELLDEVKKAF